MNEHPDYLARLLLRRIGASRVASIMGSQTTGSAQGSTMLGSSQSQTVNDLTAVEIRDTDPTGTDLRTGRMWGLGGMLSRWGQGIRWGTARKWGATQSTLKWYDGLSTRTIAMVDQLPATSDTDVLAVFDGGGAALTTGVKLDLTLDFACSVLAWTLLLDAASTVRVDVWKDSYGNYPPTVADSLAGVDANKPQTAAAVKASGGVTGWTTTAIAAGDTLRFNLDVATVAARATLALKLRRT